MAVQDLQPSVAGHSQQPCGPLAALGVPGHVYVTVSAPLLDVQSCGTTLTLTLAWTAEHPTLAEAEGLQQLAAQWHLTLNGSLTPADFATSSNYKAWWLCPVGSTSAACGHHHAF